jgi:ribosome biogenesis protein Nip4
MSAIMKFASQLGAKFHLKGNITVNKAGRYFLLNESLLKLSRQNFYYAGIYLGKVKNGKFFPSFNLLTMIAKGEANKVTVNRKAAWLFICGRDIFRTGIVTLRGSRKKGDPTLVLNEFNECLGFGRLVCNLVGTAKKGEIAIKNVSDVGDFLRREI